jgi:hypothetical protein
MTNTTAHHDDDVTADLEDLRDRQATARAATAQAHGSLAAARAARAAAIVDGNLAAQHIERLADARNDLEECVDVEAELARRYTALAGEAPAPAATGFGDPRTVRVRVAGFTGRHSCNQPSTGRALIGGEELTLPADDALTLAGMGHVRVVGKVPAWWPNSVPIPDESTALAVAVR